MLLSPMKKAKPLESNINIILGVLGALNFLKGHLSQVLNPTFHKELHGVFLKLHFFLRDDASPVLFLQNPEPISLLHSRLQPWSLHLRGGSCRSHRWGGGGAEPCLGPRAGEAWWWRSKKTNREWRRHYWKKESSVLLRILSFWGCYYGNGGLREECTFCRTRGPEWTRTLQVSKRSEVIFLGSIDPSVLPRVTFLMKTKHF